MTPEAVKSEDQLADAIKQWEKESDEAEKHSSQSPPNVCETTATKMMLPQETTRQVELDEHRYGGYQQMRNEIMRYA